ncbi:MAG TPA: TonB-dependent receptor [Gemmatimonadales bacterium]|jgi:iron complex outermembrane receptor protein|nr:TonB-dependent receptor [Gemmatimonadales bacterium]
MLRVQTAGPVLAFLALSAFGSSLAAQQADTSAGATLDNLLSTPVSTASKYAQNVREVAGSVTIVSAEDIRRYGYRTLTDVLQRMAGVYVSNQRSMESFGIRGFGRPTDYNNRVLLLINGHSYTEGIWGMALLGESMALNLQGVERIELVRGPSSGLYGTGAMFAVINVISKDGQAISGVQMDAETGSLGRRSVGIVAGTALGNRASVSVSAMHEDVDGNPSLFFPAYNDPATNNGIAENLDWMHRTGVQFSGTLGSFSLRASHSYRERSDPTGSYGARFNAPDNFMDQFRFVELANVSELSPTKLLASRVYYDDIRYAGTYPLSGGGTFHQNAVNRVLGTEASLRWDLVPRDRVTIGGEYRRYLESRLSSPDDPAIVVGRPFSVGSLYLQNEFQLTSNLTFLAGVRHDEHEIAGGATTPRVALLFDPWKSTTFKLMYGEAFRPPTFYESAFKSSSIIGDIGPEKLDMYEAIWLQSLGKRYSLSSSLFYYHVHNLIDAVQLYEYVNLADVVAKGFEVTFDARPTAGTSGYLNYTFQDADLGGSDLTNMPMHMVKGGLGTDLFRQATAAVEFRYESSRVTPQATTTDGFIVANGTLTLRPFSTVTSRSGLLAGLEFGLHVENLFNKRYSNPGSVEHLQASLEQNGRTFVLRLTSRF